MCLLAAAEAFGDLPETKLFFFQASNLTVEVERGKEQQSPVTFQTHTQFLVFHRHVGCEKVETKRDQQF